MSIADFKIKVPQTTLEELQGRLVAARWPQELPNSGWSYGMPKAFVQNLVDYWRNAYDWRKTEARLNAYPQFTTTIDGQNVHFLHVRSHEPDALPLILTRGWPGSVIEYLDIIERLTNPREFGVDSAQPFHLVIPSLPGYGFSGPTFEAGWNQIRIAKTWAELMSRLGYKRYGAVGNDAGSMISPQIGRIDPDHVVGIHVTQIFSVPSGDPSDFIDLSEEEQEGVQRLQWFMDNRFAFNKLQSTQPQLLAFALSDSPTGLLAWNSQLFDEGVDKDFVLDNVMLYWLTETVASAARLYYENARAPQSAGQTTVPLGLSMFEGDFISIRRFAERDHKNIVQWKRHKGGGHYAAHLLPDILCSDIRELFSRLLL